jgi:hypothetical protein
MIARSYLTGPQSLMGLLDPGQAFTADHQNTEPVGAAGPEHHMQALHIPMPSPSVSPTRDR